MAHKNGKSTQNRFVAPDFKRRQLIFDSFTKLKRANSEIRSGRGGSHVAGPKGTLLYTWGAGYHGQLGLSSYRKKCKLVPAWIEFKEPVVQVACGGFHTAVLTDSGNVWTWGDGRMGQLGNLARKHNMHATPHLVEKLSSMQVVVTQISCGQYHTACISEKGDMYSWGSGKYGQLGHGTRLDERYPRKLEVDSSIGPFFQVCCGDRHTAAVTRSKKVVTFGSGQHGQLGHGNGYDYLKPKIVEALLTTPTLEVTAGSTHTCAISESGILFMWGFGESLHPKEMTNIVDTPRIVKMKERVKQVACGQSHVLILTESGDVYAFGSGGMGQIGHGSNTNVRHPRLVLKGKDISEIGAGRYHSMAVTAYGVLYSWGCGESGQLAHNSLENEYFPRIVEAILTNVVGQICCGEHHSFCLSSIEHASVSQDVLNWKMIEDEELKLKKTMLKELPNGLKTKHVLQVEKERQRIIQEITDDLKKEKEDEQRHLNEQLDSISGWETLMKDVEEAAKKRAEEEGEDKTTELVPPSTANFKDMPSEQSLSVAGANGNLARKSGGNRLLKVMMGRGLNSSKSSPALKKSPRFFSSNKSLSPSPKAASSSPLDSDALDSAPASSPGLSISIGPVPTTPSNAAASGAVALSPSVGAVGGTASSLNPSASLGSLSPNAATMDRNNRLARSQPSLRPVSSPSPWSRSAPGAGISASNALQPSAAGGAAEPTAAPFQPLLPRMIFMEKTTNALARVKKFLQSGAMKPQFTDTKDVFNYKKQYNELRALSKAKAKHLENLRNAYVFMRPTEEDMHRNMLSQQRIKELNMKLVTLNTRLMEADENKKNYELYIIRMKEEDVQLSKQIDHLRHLVVEYDRLLAKMDKMNSRITLQSTEIDEEIIKFQTEIQEFSRFAQDQLAKYRERINKNITYARLHEKHALQRENKLDEKRMKRLMRLQQEYENSAEEATEIKEELEKWQEKVTFYEQRFHKITAATGLSRPEDIINKFFFNDEITEDLQKEIMQRSKEKEQLLEKKRQLENALDDGKTSFVNSKWRDVDLLQEKLYEMELKRDRQRDELDKLTQKLALVQEGVVSLVNILGDDFGTDKKSRKKKNMPPSSSAASNETCVYWLQLMDKRLTTLCDAVTGDKRKKKNGRSRVQARSRSKQHSSSKSRDFDDPTAVDSDKDDDAFVGSSPSHSPKNSMSVNFNEAGGASEHSYLPHMSSMA